MSGNCEVCGETICVCAVAQSRAEGANSNAGLERSFEAWWEAHGQFHRAGGGQYEKTFAYHAWIDSAIAEREACANTCEALRDEWARLKIGATDGRYDMMEDAASVCEDEIRERSNE